MKFCDKLQKIRKENNVTQEQLADKLNVSRQAVSKWESGTAYPDTEKLIQISKIFNVSLDELVNDSKDMNKREIDKKISFMETFNMIFEFVRKVMSMFWAMKFGEKIKFLIEMALLILVIIGASVITNDIICAIVRRLFIFMPGNILNGIIYFVDTLLYIVWIILGIIIFVRVLKTRYLDYYVIITDDSVKERKVEEPIKELKEKKEYKVVIRDPKHSSYNILKKIWKIFVFIFKCLAIFIAIPVVMSFICFMILFVFSLMYLFSGIFFNGISLAILGIIIFVFIVIYFLYNLIFNRKNSYSKMFMLFMLSITLVGVGIGLSFVAIANFEINDGKIVKDNNIETIEMKDNLLIPEFVDIDREKIVIDNTLADIKLDISSCMQGKVIFSTRYINTYDDDLVGMENYQIVNIYYDYNEFEQFKKIVKDLRQKKIDVNNICGYEIDKVYISEENLTKINENNSKFFD